MKKIIFFLLIAATAFAQVPQGISYQAIALNGSGNPVVSGNVGIRLSLMDNSATGTVIYKETHTKTTNAQGLFNLTIGQGTVVTGTFAGINWGTNPKFLKVEIDAAGGTNYVAVGTTQLLSVPYAMYAKSTASVPVSALAGIGSNGLKTSAFVVADGSSVKGFYNGIWSTQAFNSEVYESEIIAADGNFMIIDGSSVKGFANGVWSTQAFNSEVYESEVVGSNGNYVILDGSSVKAFSNGAWTTQSFNGEVYESEVIASNGNFVIVDGSSVKGFSNGVWSTQAFSSEVYASEVIESNGNFLIIDNSTVKAFYNGVWSSQAFSGEVYSSEVLSSPKN